MGQTIINENGYEVHSGLLQDGNGRIYDAANILGSFSQSINNFNHLTTAEYTPIIELKPYPSISSLRNEMITPGNGDLYLDKGLIQMESPNSTDKVELYTRKRGRYLPGIIGVAGIGYDLDDNGTATYEIGYFVSDEGFGLFYDQGTFKTFVRRDGVQYYEQPRDQWIDPLDGTGPSGIDADITRAVLRSSFVWYGFGTIEFNLVISSREKGDQTVLIDRAYAPSEGTILYQPDLPVSATCLNGSIGIGGRQFGVYGRYLPLYRINYKYHQKDIGNTFEPVISVRTKQETRWVSVPVCVQNASFIATEKIEWRVTYDSILSKNGGDVPDDEWYEADEVDPEDTAVEFNTTGTDVTNGYPIYGDIIETSGTGVNQSGAVSTVIPKILIPAGSSATLEARTLDTSATLDATFMVCEEH